MFDFFRKMSLRARLFWLTAFAFTALLIALLSAFRTAQTSAAFAERQTESDVDAAAQEISRQADEIGKDFLLQKRKDKVPPHIRDIFNRYSDDYSRATAIALHRFPEVSGGFCASNGDVKGEILAERFTANELQIARQACRQILSNDDFPSNKFETENGELYFAAAPVSLKSDSGDSVANNTGGVFAFKTLPSANGFSDKFSFLTQGFLLLSVVGLAVFSFQTLRDWRRGMSNIENGLDKISRNLTSRIDAPKIAELGKIGAAINALAKNLEINLQRQKQLETDLTRNEKLAALGRVASGVAHEVRNPLASMKLKIQLAERADFAPEKLEKTFRVLREEIERLDDLVKKLLETTRPTKLIFAPLDLNQLLKQRLNLIEEKATAQNVALRFDAAVTDITINGDGEKLAQVFDNLFLNALEAMPDGGTLRVTVENLAAFVRVKVSDDGEGIGKDAGKKLFEPFFTTKDRGTGLGLAISREIMETHGGKIYFNENNTKGAAFVVEIPTKL